MQPLSWKAKLFAGTVVLLVTGGITGCAASNTKKVKPTAGPSTSARPVPDRAALLAARITKADVPANFKEDPEAADEKGDEKPPQGANPDCTKRISEIDQLQHSRRKGFASAGFDTDQEGISEDLSSYAAVEDAKEVLGAFRSGFSTCPVLIEKEDGDEMTATLEPIAGPTVGDESFAFKMSMTVKSAPDVTIRALWVFVRVGRVIVELGQFGPVVVPGSLDTISQRAIAKVQPIA